ncbi:helix-turn-helix domain-containing protein [Polyangium spumosum]|uniref:Helix-turn-helix domain-containing protein n=1 Tax=Polyangium spumosum TaxID=889282 RepID=A0A6N7PWB8_9BACT|nr:helix-turn-helix domain-containing protein [Polyangium spumosum]
MATALKRVLVETGIPQYQVAQRAGLTETRLSRLATGRATPTEDELQRLAEALGVDTDCLRDS